MIYTTKVVKICENGDAIVELPDELVKELNWQVGDTLDYQMKDKAVYIKNLSKEKRDASVT
jgi:uncharacterized membrane protein (UPF0127 family)